MKAAALALSLSGCVTIGHNAVRVAQADTENADSCYRGCQQTRTGGIDAYLGCVKACPGVSVEAARCPGTQAPDGAVCVEEAFKYVNYVPAYVTLMILTVASSVMLLYTP